MTLPAYRLILSLLFAVTLNSLADYIQARIDAVTLERQGQAQKALAAYLNLAEIAKTDLQTSDALDLAATTAGRLGEWEQAMDLAQQIPLKPMAVTRQMWLLEAQRRWPEALTLGGGIDLSQWPDSIISSAAHVRGLCYFYTDQGEQAQDDLQRALAYATLPNDKALILLNLGHNLRTKLKDPDAALQAYRRVLDTGVDTKSVSALSQITNLLLAAGKPAEALEELRKLPPEAVTEPTFWRPRLLLIRARTFQQAGDLPAALQTCRTALAAETIAESVRSELEALLAELEQR